MSKKSLIVPIVSFILIFALFAGCSKQGKDDIQHSEPPTQGVFESPDNMDASPTPAVSALPPEVEPVDSPGITVEENKYSETFKADDGTIVLEVSISLPRVSLTDADCVSINQYYENQLEKQRVVAAEELYPQALEEYQNSLKSGAAFTAFVSRQSTYTAFNRDGFVSFLRNYFESGGETDRLMLHAETFSLPDCGLIIADDLFSVSEEEYLRALAQNVCSIIDAGGGSGYYENCSALAERALQKEDFYLSENGLVIFYQAATLAPASLGPMQFTIPYNSLEDIFVLW